MPKNNPKNISVPETAQSQHVLCQSFSTCQMTCTPLYSCMYTLTHSLHRGLQTVKEVNCTYLPQLLQLVDLLGRDLATAHLVLLRRHLDQPCQELPGPGSVACHWFGSLHTSTAFVTEESADSECVFGLFVSSSYHRFGSTRDKAPGFQRVPM